MVKFREFVLSSGRVVYGGKDSASNDELVFGALPNDVLIHTDAPGSPFVKVGEGASKVEIKEAAVFCAKYSQVWRDGKKDVVVGVFLKKDMVKDKRMKEGSWRVLKSERVVVKKGEILKFEAGLENN